MIANLNKLAVKLGIAAVFFPLAFGVLATGVVFGARSVAEWFDNRNP